MTDAAGLMDQAVDEYLSTDQTVDRSGREARGNGPVQRSACGAPSSAVASTKPCRGSMKIVYLAAGAGGMFAGSCLHDNTLSAALLGLGEDVVLMPTYTPIRTDEQDVSERRVMFGGISVYLQQKWGVFRHTPVAARQAVGSAASHRLGSPAAA